MNIKRITTEADLHAALNIRKTVFIEEQHVSESEEFDEFDTLRNNASMSWYIMRISLSARAVCASLTIQQSWKESAS